MPRWRSVRRLFQTRSLRRLAQTPYNYGLGGDAVASAVLSRELNLKPEQKRLAAGDVSQRLLIRRAKELIAQGQPAAQL